MADNKATPEQWDNIEGSAWGRMEALEAQAGNLKGSLTSSTPPPVATDEELLEIWKSERACRPWVSRRAIYNLGIEHGQASSREVAEPAPVAGGLVERITLAIDRAPFDEGDHLWDEAHAAILEQAEWLREQGWEKAADLLEQEAGR